MTTEPQVEEQRGRVLNLQMLIYSQPDPAADAALLDKLATEQAKLAELEKQQAAEKSGEQEKQTDSKGSQPRGRFLGEKTTQLNVASTIHMNPLPTGAYHLMDPETEPLLTVEVENFSRDVRRVLVKAYIEGLSAQSVKTVEIEPREKVALHLQPSLFPDKAQLVTEIQRATLHIVAEDLDSGKLERHDTRVITCLARTASFNSVRRETGETVDLSHYYAAWVTPHAPSVQEKIRRAVELMPDRRMLGYQGDPDGVPQQVGAIYQALREAEIVYVNSVIDYGAPAGMTTQRTRLPRESLEMRSANCIDGTVLMASMMEGVSLNPAIVLVPGHAFVAWEAWQGSEEWEYLETTLIGTSDFEAACKSGKRQFEQLAKFNADRIKIHPVAAMRARGVYPME